MGDKSAENVLDSIEKSKTQPLWRLIAGLGIRNVGGQSAQILAEEFGSLEALMKCRCRNNFRPSSRSARSWPKAFMTIFTTPDNIKIIKELLAAGVKPAAPKQKASDALAGKTIVVTGTLTHFTRQQIEQTIKDHGGKSARSVSKKTSFVVAGENAGSKLDKATQLGVEVIDENEFKNRLQRKAD